MMIRTFSLAAILSASVAIPAVAQTTPAPAPTPPVTVSPAPSMTAPTSSATSSVKMTADQALAWVNKPVYSSDDKKIGEVVSFTRGTDNTVMELQAGIGGFFGMGETRIKVTPAQFKLQDDRVILNVTAAQAKDLPKVK